MMIYVVEERSSTARQWLAEMIGVPDHEMMAESVWLTLRGAPGSVPENTVTMVEQAAQHNDAILLIGRRVAEAFSLGDRPAWHRIIRNAGVGPVLLLLPSPSGASLPMGRAALHDIWLRSGR